MLHHLTEDGRRPGIGEIRRVLKPGGRLLAIDLGHGGKGGRHGMFHRLRGHAHFGLDELTPELESQALEVVERGAVDSSGVVGLSNLRLILARVPAP